MAESCRLATATASQSGFSRPAPTRARAEPALCSHCDWTSSRSLFLGAFRKTLTLPSSSTLPSRRGPRHARTTAMGDPEAWSYLSAGVGFLGPLGNEEGATLLRAAAATSLSAWYLTAKPGALQGLLDVVWTPSSEQYYKSFLPTTVRVGKQLGEGSFGVVYKGWIKDPKAAKGGPGVPVVLKKVKSRVSGAEEMRTSELYFNQRLERTAKGACAEFLGTIEVDRAKHTGKLSSKLSEGLWLVWRYQGPSTLEWFLRRRDALGLLAEAVLGDKGVQVRATKEDMLQRDCAVVQAVTRNLLGSLHSIHATGVIHRDVKPLNMVYDEESRSFKLIDLGACVDLRSGYNYIPDETIMDPVYCAPEQYILPINMPEAPASPLMSLLAPLLFLAHAPDKFDLYSAGLVLLQLAVPTLRADRSLFQFNEQLAAVGYDLDRWRTTKCALPKSDLDILDANGGAAWDLARSLLQPRNGLVCARPTADVALQHRFLTQKLTWQVDEQRVGSAKRGSLRERVLPVPGFGLFAGSKSAAQAVPGLAEAPPPKKQRRNLLPSFLWRHQEDTSEVGSEVGARFDRKVKLKADPRGTQSVQWSAFLPLSLPSKKLSQIQEAPLPPTVTPSTDRLLGLKRLVGLETPAAVVLAPAPPPPSEEYPHVAALAALLGQRDQAAPETLGQEADPLSNSVVQVERVSENRIQKNAVPLALAAAVLGGGAWLEEMFVKPFVEHGYHAGQSFAQFCGTAGLLYIVYLYILRPGLTASPVRTSAVLPVAPAPAPTDKGSAPLYARIKRKAGSILERAGLDRAGPMTLGYTKWIVKQAKQAPLASAASGEGKGLLRSLKEMEQQLASLEEAARDGREFNKRQKQLLSRVEALLQVTTKGTTQ